MESKPKASGKLSYNEVQHIIDEQISSIEAQQIKESQVQVDCSNQPSKESNYGYSLLYRFKQYLKRFFKLKK